MSQPPQYIFWVLEYGGKDTPTYNLDVSLISDFLDSLTPENMIVASLGLADTEEDDLFGDLEVFELYGVNHTVSELKKTIKVNVKLTLPSELKEPKKTHLMTLAAEIRRTMTTSSWMSFACWSKLRKATSRTIC